MKIIAPNKSYTGVSASVTFTNGVGETDNSHLIQWFRDHGYMVEDREDISSDPKPETEDKEQSGAPGKAVDPKAPAENMQETRKKTEKKSVSQRRTKKSKQKAQSDAMPDPKPETEDKEQSENPGTIEDPKDSDNAQGPGAMSDPEGEQ